MAIAPQSGGFLTLLQKRDFLYLWLAQLISMTILNASNFALLILIHRLTDSDTMVGLAVICFSVPAILFGAPAGVLVDHMSKRRVLWVSNCLRAFTTLLFVLSLLFARSTLLPVFLLTFIISAIGQFFTPAEGATIPRLVSSQELVPALSLFNITFMLSQALGYILFAPLLIKFLPTLTLAGVALDSIVQLNIIIAFLYLACAVLILLIPATRWQQAEKRAPKEMLSLSAQAASSLKTMWRETREGWDFIRTRKALFLAVVQLSFAGVLILVIGQIVLPVVKDLLQMSEDAIALVFAPAGIGLVLGSLVMPRIAQRLGKSRTVLLGCLGLTLAMALLPLVTSLARWLQPVGWNGNPLLWLAAGCIMFSAGVALDFVNIPAQTAMQELSPDWIKGRVLALQLVLYNACSIPVLLFCGVIIDFFGGIGRALFILAVGSLLFGIWGQVYARRYPVQRLEKDFDVSALASAEHLVPTSPELID